MMSLLLAIFGPESALLCGGYTSSKKPDLSEHEVSHGLVCVYLKSNSGNEWVNYWERKEMRLATMLEF